jgi:succinyl-CoA synthetase beta subunit
MSDLNDSISPEKEEGIAVVSAKISSTLDPSDSDSIKQDPGITSDMHFENDEPVCKMHRKPIEAFCEEDSQLVCINCILSNDHKGHTLNAIDKAIDIQITHIGKEYERSKDIKNSIEKQKHELNDKLKTLLDA